MEEAIAVADDDPQPAKDVAVAKTNLPATNGWPVEDGKDGREVWAHAWIEFKGDRLAVRKPPDQALIALSVSSSKFVPPQRQNDVVGMFIERYLSPMTYDRVMSRLMDPDDTDYTIETLGELMREVSEVKAPEDGGAGK